LARGLIDPLRRLTKNQDATMQQKLKQTAETKTAPRQLVA